MGVRDRETAQIKAIATTTLTREMPPNQGPFRVAATEYPTE